MLIDGTINKLNDCRYFAQGRQGQYGGCFIFCKTLEEFRETLRFALSNGEEIISIWNRKGCPIPDDYKYEEQFINPAYTAYKVRT